jgi:Domain of unknown function (DUF5011)
MGRRHCCANSRFPSDVNDIDLGVDNLRHKFRNQTNANSSSDTPPVIQINGGNPAIVQVGNTYNDLGATITGPQSDLNLGIQTYLNGTLTSNIVIDTTQVATDTIQYVATDQSGLTSTSTRTVIIEPAHGRQEAGRGRIHESGLLRDRAVSDRHDRAIEQAERLFLEKANAHRACTHKSAMSSLPPKSGHRWVTTACRSWPI